MMYNIQFLRAVAALLVVHAHAAGVAGLGLNWDAGAYGVDLFFVISGFIIAYVASIDTSQFIVRRLIRIVPIYWSSTLGLYTLVILFPSLFRTASSDFELLIRSLLFVPDGSNVHTSDGLPHPTLAGGWTLNYEIYFYATFAIGLAISRRWATLISGVLLTSVVAVVHVGGLDAHPIAHFYGYPIVFEFVFGMIAFQLLRYAERIASTRRPSSGSRWLLGVGMVGGLFAISALQGSLSAVPRWIAAGVPSFLIVACATLLETFHNLKVTNRLIVRIGDASYVLYLIQAYVVYGAIRLLVGRRDLVELTGQLVAFTVIALAVVASLFIHDFYEQPILRFLKRRLIRRRLPTRVTIDGPSSTASVARTA